MSRPRRDCSTDQVERQIRMFLRALRIFGVCVVITCVASCHRVGELFQLYLYQSRIYEELDDYSAPLLQSESWNSSCDIVYSVAAAELLITKNCSFKDITEFSVFYVSLQYLRLIKMWRRWLLSQMMSPRTLTLFARFDPPVTDAFSMSPRDLAIIPLPVLELEDETLQKDIASCCTTVKIVSFAPVSTAIFVNYLYINGCLGFESASSLYSHERILFSELRALLHFMIDPRVFDYFFVEIFDLLRAPKLSEYFRLDSTRRTFAKFRTNRDIGLQDLAGFRLIVVSFMNSFLSIFPSIYFNERRIHFFFSREDRESDCIDLLIHEQPASLAWFCSNPALRMNTCQGLWARECTYKHFFDLVGIYVKSTNIVCTLQELVILYLENCARLGFTVPIYYLPNKMLVLAKLSDVLPELNRFVMLRASETALYELLLNDKILDILGDVLIEEGISSPITFYETFDIKFDPGFGTALNVSEFLLAKSKLYEEFSANFVELYSRHKYAKLNHSSWHCLLSFKIFQVLMLRHSLASIPLAAMPIVRLYEVIYGNQVDNELAALVFEVMQSISMKLRSPKPLVHSSSTRRSNTSVHPISKDACHVEKKTRVTASRSLPTPSLSSLLHADIPSFTNLIAALEFYGRYDWAIRYFATDPMIPPCFSVSSKSRKLLPLPSMSLQQFLDFIAPYSLTLKLTYFKSVVQTCSIAFQRSSPQKSIIQSLKTLFPALPQHLFQSL